MPRETSDKTAGGARQNTLSDLLDAYRPSADIRSIGTSSDTGKDAFRSWDVIHRRAHGRSARDWRADWTRQRRAPLKLAWNWRPLAFIAGAAIAVGLALFGVYQLDALLNRMHWHWMNPNGAEQPTDNAPPVIHWQGQ